MWIDIGCFKLGLKPAQLYGRLSIILISYQSTYISSGIIRHYVVAFICLHFASLDTRVLKSYEELCITRVAAVVSFTRVLNSCVYIVIHRQTVSLYEEVLVSHPEYMEGVGIYTDISMNICIYVFERSWKCPIMKSYLLLTFCDN